MYASGTDAEINGVRGIMFIVYILIFALLYLACSSHKGI